MKSNSKFYKFYYAETSTFLVFIRLIKVEYGLVIMNLNLVFINLYPFNMDAYNIPKHLVFEVIMRKLYFLIFIFSLIIHFLLDT